MNISNKSIVLKVAVAFLVLLTTACNISGSKNTKRDFSILEMEQMTQKYMEELRTIDKEYVGNKKSKRSLECITREIVRSVNGAYAGQRTELKVYLTRQCSQDLAILSNGYVVASNCVNQLNTKQDEMAYLVAHAYAHTLLEHDNERVTVFLKEKDFDKDNPNVKKVLRGIDGYVEFGEMLGRVNPNGVKHPYSEEHEYLADQLALQFMAISGFNPSAIFSFYERMSAESNNPKYSEYLKLHPHSPEALKKVSNELIEPTLSLYNKATKEYFRIPQCQF